MTLKENPVGLQGGIDNTTLKLRRAVAQCMVECLTRNRGDAGSSLTGGTV